MPHLSVSIVKMEKEIVDINVRLSQAVTQQFRHSFEFPEVWIATLTLDHHLLV